MLDNCLGKFGEILKIRMYKCDEILLFFKMRSGAAVLRSDGFFSGAVCIRCKSVFLFRFFCIIFNTHVHYLIFNFGSSLPKDARVNSVDLVKSFQTSI